MIYYDEDRAIFYYPLVAVEAYEDLPLKQVVGTPPIKVEDGTGNLIDTNGERYIAFHSQEEFQLLRKKAKRNMGRTEEKVGKSPLFHEVGTGRRYYPESAFTEPLDVERDVGLKNYSKGSVRLRLGV